MRRRRIFVWIGLVLILALIPLVSVQAGKGYDLSLDWHEVVPSGSGNPNMFGDGTIDVNAGKGRVCYTMRIFIYPSPPDWPPTGVAIHKAPAGSNGPQVVDLQPNFGAFGEPNISGCVNIDGDLAHDIQRRPSQYYLLVSDSTHPQGAVRDQLGK